MTGSIKRIYAAIVLALTALLLAATAAFALVSFDPATGTGFVGKGDVQLAYGWNNAQLQQNAQKVEFSYDSTENYAAVCTWTTGEGTRGEKTHNISLKRHQSISAALDGDPRQVKGQKQFTGFILKGYLGDPVTSGSTPAVGSACVGNEEGINHNGTYTSVELVSSIGGLYVNHPDFGSRLLQ